MQIRMSLVLNQCAFNNSTSFCQKFRFDSLVWLTISSCLQACCNINGFVWSKNLHFNCHLLSRQNVERRSSPSAKPQPRTWNLTRKLNKNVAVSHFGAMTCSIASFGKTCFIALASTLFHLQTRPQSMPVFLFCTLQPGRNRDCQSKKSKSQCLRFLARCPIS